MGVKYRIFVVLATFLVLAAGSVGAVDTRGIDRVRNKGVLDNRDLQIIDDFVADAVWELVETEDFTSIAKTRQLILERSGSATDSAAAQYDEQFSESAYKYIAEGLKEAEQLTPQDSRLKVMINLLILADSLESLRLVDLAISRLNDDNAVVRYWAVHSVTNRGITKQLNSAAVANLKLAKKIAEQLKKLVDQASPEMMALMVGFASELSVPQGEDLLRQIADVRIRRYADWTVDYELLDADILKALHKKMAGVGDVVIARRFGQLYSYVMQRYIKGENFLDSDHKRQLVSAMVEIEKSCINKLLGVPQSIIQKAVEKDDVTALLLEHNRLLGDKTRAGQLAVKLNFDYGAAPDGSKRTAPLDLPEPPKNL